MTFRPILIGLSSLAIILIVAALASAQSGAVIDLHTSWDEPTNMDDRQGWLDYAVQFVDANGDHQSVHYSDLSGAFQGANSDDEAHTSYALQVSSVPGWNPDSPYITFTCVVRAAPFPSVSNPNYVLHQEVNAPLGPWYRVYSSTWGYLEYDAAAKAWEPMNPAKKMNIVIMQD